MPRAEMLAFELIPRMVSHLHELEARGALLTGKQRVFLRYYLGKDLVKP